MLAYTRERILQHLAELPSLINLYQTHDPDFIPNAVIWLSQVEGTLLQLRLPAVSSIAAGRARIIAALDGYYDGQLSSEKMSRRKASMLITSLVLSQAQDQLYKAISDIDVKFELWREKLAQFLAVASIKKPIPLPITEPRDVWLKNVWIGFDLGDETQGMYRYINAVTQLADRLFLLGELINNSFNE